MAGTEEKIALASADAENPPLTFDSGTTSSLACRLNSVWQLVPSYPGRSGISVAQSSSPASAVGGP